MKWKFEKFTGDGAIYAFCPNCNYHYAAGGSNPPTWEPRVDKQFPFCPGCGEFLWCEDDEIEVVKYVRNIREIVNENINSEAVGAAIDRFLKQRSPYVRTCTTCGYVDPTEDFENINGEDVCYTCSLGYTPVCPRGYIDCVYDPAYIKHHYPKWYKSLYGDLSPEEAIHDSGGCVERMEDDPDEKYGCYDNEDK